MKRSPGCPCFCNCSIGIQVETACLNDCGFPTPTYITVKDSGGTVLATYTTTSSSDVFHYAPTHTGTYTVEAVPSDTSWFGSVSSTVTIDNTCNGVVFATGMLLPFLHSDTYTCWWCGDAFVPKQLYLTDGAGTLSFAYSDTTHQWEAIRTCEDLDYKYTMLPKGDCTTGALIQVNYNNTLAGCAYSDVYQYSNFDTCSPLSGTFSAFKCTVSYECAQIFNTITISE